MILEALGQLFDVLRRPPRHFHAEMQAHLRQHFLDLVQRLAAKVRGPQHFGFGPQIVARRVTFADLRVTQPSLQRSYLVPSYTTAKNGEAEALDLLAYILGG